MRWFLQGVDLEKSWPPVSRQGEMFSAVAWVKSAPNQPHAFEAVSAPRQLLKQLPGLGLENAPRPTAYRSYGRPRISEARL